MPGSFGSTAFKVTINQGEHVRRIDRVIRAGADQTIRIWDAHERQELAGLRGHLSEINCVAISRDGKTMVSGCKDGTLFGWDAEHSERKKSFATLPHPVANIEFFPDSHALVSVNSDGTVGLWDSATLQERERISALGGEVERIIVSPDGTRLYASSRRGQIKVLDWATRLIITNWTDFTGRGRSAGPIGLIDEGRTLVAAGGDGSIRLRDTATWQPKAAWKANALPPSPSQMARSPDERFLLVAGFDGPLRFLNLLTGQTEATARNGDWGITGITFSPDGSLLATSSTEGMVNLWNPSNRTIMDVLRGNLLGVHAVAFSPDGQRLASASVGNEAVKLWDVTTRHEVATLASEGSLFERVKFSPDGPWIVAIKAQGQAHFWRAPALQEIEQAEMGKRR